MRSLSAEGCLWGLIRLGMVIFLIAGMAFWSASLFAQPERFPWILFTLQGLRYWIFPIAGFICAILLAGHFISNLYELSGVRSGIRHVFASAFSLGLPVMTIEQGRRTLAPDRPNLLDQVGGPGYIHVLPGNLALIENQTGPSNVFSQGDHLISRREHVKEVISLEDQHGYIEEINATTKDGIEMTVSEIRYHFRLRPSRRSGEYVPRSPLDPFPYTMQYMRNYAYNRSVTTSGLTPLSSAMNIIIMGGISDYINSHRFDDLTAPAWSVAPHPRGVIRESITNEMQDRFRNLGMELLWVDIGHFGVSQEVWDWRVRTWGATWAGHASLERNLGKVRRLTYDRLARAEGRADALKLIIEKLEDARLGGEPAVNLRNLILLYTAQILDELNATDRTANDETGELPAPPPIG